jgi:ABC-type bacteriocin/lantibiotic exporter with double-glycine peptidase domain
MPLAVPHLRTQAQNDCDIAVCQSLLQFYDLPVTRRSLLVFLHQHRFGSTITEIAECLLHHGLKTTLVSANPFLFSHDRDEYFSDALGETAEKYRSHVKELQRVLESGVLLKTQVPTVKILKTQLAQKHPVIVSLNRAILTKELGVIFHYAIVTGIEGNTATLMDPASPHKSITIPLTLLEFSITSLTAINPFAGTILLSEPFTHAKNS